MTVGDRHAVRVSEWYGRCQRSRHPQGRNKDISPGDNEPGLQNREERSTKLPVARGRGYE